MGGKTGFCGVKGKLWRTVKNMYVVMTLSEGNGHGSSQS